MPLASRRLGRSDESWLIQVLVRLRIIETHFALYSPIRCIQIDHLQNSVSLGPAEIDALYLAICDSGGGNTEEIIVTFEAKGRKDDILEDQIGNQVLAIFGTPTVTQDRVIPMAAKALDISTIYVIEFEPVLRSSTAAPIPLMRASEAIYELVPPVPGIGA